MGKSPSIETRHQNGWKLLDISWDTVQYGLTDRTFPTSCPFHEILAAYTFSSTIVMAINSFFQPQVTQLSSSIVLGPILAWHITSSHNDVFVFNSGHRNQVTCSLLGGFSKPRAEVIQLLDSGLCRI